MSIYTDIIIKLAAQGLVSSKTQAAQFLGIQPNATIDEIKKAYKAKAVQMHPDLHPEKAADMKMLNAAKDFMIAYYGMPDPEPEIVQEPISEPESDEPDPSQMSFEDIRDIRNELGKEEFNRQYPGWESELRSEMGQEAYNAMFEGYSEEYEPEYGGDQEQAVESAWEYLVDNAFGTFSDYLDTALDEMEKEFSEDTGFSSPEEYVYETISEWFKHRAPPPDDKNEDNKSILDIAIESITRLNREQKRVKFNSEELKRIAKEGWEKALLSQIRMYGYAVKNKKAVANTIQLSELLINKYAKNKDMHCNCEQAKCQQIGAHAPTKCRNTSTGKGAMYLGPICDECALFLDPLYIISVK